ncbi:LysR family transcriptional regulator [Streptomyces specialis]|uniref:LysR family transcriptional regulator n=1 Tax=Streptomyces specialis TaxID=498367 RepID=UPI00073E8BA9|nr:LysR family transcriptional regulator [Streptomyces specialis]
MRVRLNRVDLNLLTSLRALLRHRSVTRAAEELMVSQPTMSAALARLRRHFEDDLLTRVGNRSELTPFARQLCEHVEVAARAVDGVFGTRPGFSPRGTRRQFVVAASDYALPVIGDELLRIIDASGEGVRVRFAPLATAATERPDEFLRDVDTMIMPHGALSDVPHLDLFEDRWVCLLDESNPAATEGLTRDALSTLPWVMTYHHATMSTLGARTLRMHGIEPDVRLGTDSFLAVPSLVTGTNNLALLQRRLVSTVGLPPGVKAVEFPFESPVMRLALWWHPSRESDPAHRWLRDQFLRAASYLPDLDPSLFHLSAPSTEK